MQPTLEQIRDFKGKYPKQLHLLFFTEMWERFTFYGNRALLILFMVNYLKFDDVKGNIIYGVYQSLIYAMPVLGGFMADRILGQRKSILWGGILLALGSFVMAIPVKESFFIGMGIMIVGNGYFKPNISTIVGSLYKDGDGRRDAGFSYFYMGINIGATLGGLLCGWVGQKISWHLGFGLAGLFMIVGLITFYLNQKRLGPIGLPPSDENLKRKSAMGISNEMLVYLLSLAAIPLFILILNYYKIYSYIINPFGIIALIYVIYIASKLGKEAFLKLMVAMVLIIFSALFWAFYEQGGGSLNLFAERNVNMNLFGIEFSSAAVNNSITPIFVVLLTPLFVWLWISLSKKNKEPDSVIKFALGLIQLGLGFYIYVIAAKFANDGVVSLFFFALGYFFMVTGELCLSPIGLSAITKLSPGKMVGLMMGMWFLASSYGQYLAGIIGSLMAIPTDTGPTLSAAESLPIYTDVFRKIALVAAASGVLLFMLSPILKKWMKGSG
ncbi:MAG TPA: peptide MFS transporter [Chitinophagaceae bacterium]|nr:peptide MFS transporter [Chitinophagaceae bacterium]